MNGLALDNGFRELALFAGAGGGILGGKLLGWRCVCAVEIDGYARGVLAARQNDGCLEPFPIWDDVRTFDGKPWRGIVDVVSGGFPCQDISVAGKGAGIDGERSGLWGEFARIVREVRPRFVFVENSPMLTSRGLGRVLGDLAAMGFDARWGVLGAVDAGAPHRRERIWIVAHAEGGEGVGGKRGVVDGAALGGEGGEVVADAKLRGVAKRRGIADVGEIGFVGSGGEGNDGSRNDVEKDALAADADGAGRGEQRGGVAVGAQLEAAQRGGWWGAEPAVRGVVDGLAAGVDAHGAVAAGYMGRLASGVRNRTNRIKCLGNGQAPACAALAWGVLTEDFCNMPNKTITFA